MGSGTKITRLDAIKIANEVFGVDKKPNWFLLGSIRRLKEIVGDIDILIVDEAIPKFEGFEKVSYGDRSAQLLLPEGVKVDIRVCTKLEYPCFVQFLTGSAKHNVFLRSLYKRKGYSLSQYHIKMHDGTLYYPKNEEEVYNFIGLPYIEPRDRDTIGESYEFFRTK